MKLRTLLALALVTPAVAGTLTAQTADGPCPGFYPNPQVGHYAEVQFTNAAGEGMLIRFAVVGSEAVDGRTHYWIEVVSEPPDIGENVIVQMLVPFYPFEHQDLKSYIVKLPGAPARQVPQDLLDQNSAQVATGSSWQKLCGSAEELGVEQVTVPAGTFNARHYRAGGDKTDEVWIADVPFGLVKLLQADSKMELIKHGTDAESSLTEKPVGLESQSRR
jgi:hypothetical protein